MVDRNSSRIGATCAIGDSLLLFMGTALYPIGADPPDAVAAFTKYAADRWWVASHLTQLTGIVLMDAALLVLAQQVEAVRGKAWPYVAAGSAVAGLATAAALQAVDGIALKFMVNVWAAAPPPQMEMAYHAALAVCEIGVGLVSMLCILFGLTTCLYGVALFPVRTSPQLVNGLAGVAGALTVVAGVVMVYIGPNCDMLDLRRSLRSSWNCYT